MLLRISTAIAVLIVAFTFLWRTADAHYERCVDGGRQACSMLPWDHGRATPEPAVESPTPTLEQRLRCKLSYTSDAC